MQLQPWADSIVRALRRRISKHRSGFIGLLVAATVLSVLTGLLASGRTDGDRALVAAPGSTVRQTNAGLGGTLNVATDRFPLAGRLRQRLGKRFLTQGKVATEIVGMLQRGQEHQLIRLTRSYSETGEVVTFTLAGKTAIFQWRDDSGALSDGARASADTRTLIERLVLDSPDQFVLAQLRRTAYQKIAEAVRPEESISTDKNENYTGPLWTLVQVLEAGTVADRRPLSAVRQYYLNQNTGLLDRVLSQEDGKTVTAEIAGWVERNGETFPSLITWKSGGEELMKLTVNNIGFPTRQ